MSKRSSSSVTSRESVLPDKSTQSSTLSLRTIDDVREQVAFEVAARTMNKSETVDGVRLGVMLTFSKSDDEAFLRSVADVIGRQLLLQDHVFAIATTGPSTRSDPAANTLLICGSPEQFVQRAVLLASSKLLGRIEMVKNDGNVWAAVVREIGVSAYDEQAFWDVVRKSARAPMDPLCPPPGSRGIDQILSDSRAKLQRLTPRQAYAELREPEVGAPTFLVDIRPEEQREREGGIYGSLIIERNVLEWRFDPRSPDRLAIVDRYDLRIIVFCSEGYTSSLAAFSLQELGLLNATDIIGGYQAWKDAGLPVDAESIAPSLIEIMD
ncbi:Rhodanese-like domain-containing protein [Mycena crocata]|nr:Rhodanese-like domain-containing protein [Mycena crocata]